MCQASKDSETLMLNKLEEDAVFAAIQMETLIYGDYKKRIPIHLYMNSEGTLETKTSTKEVERKSLQMVVQDMKDRLTDGEISSYQKIPTGLMWADTLTKEIRMHLDMREHLEEGNFRLDNEGINKVQCIDGEIRMLNIKN